MTRFPEETLKQYRYRREALRRAKAERCGALEQGIDLNTIGECTGLCIEEIEKL